MCLREGLYYCSNEKLIRIIEAQIEVRLCSVYGEDEINYGMRSGRRRANDSATVKGVSHYM